MKKSIFGNLNRNNATNRPKKHLELNFDGTIALGAATQLSTKNFTKTLTGTTASGYTFPSALNPIFAANAGETVEIYAQMLTDTATDAANYNTINDITIQDVTLTGTNKTKELYLITKSRGTAVGTEDKPQCMLMMIRNASGTQVPEEVEPLHFVYYTKLPSNLATILEYPTANTSFHTIFDIKTGNYGGEPGVGDYRVALVVSEDGTGLRYRLQGDNNGNGKDIVPGLTAYNNGAGGYWQEFSGYGEVVLGETIRIDFYIKPPASYGDVTTGETTVRITKVSEGSYVLLSKVGGVQKGMANLPLSRFMFILYNLGTPPGSAPYLDMPITGIEIWDKPPYFLGWTEPIDVDTSLAGGATQPRTGTDTLSIDFTSSTPEQVTIIRNDNSAYAVWPAGANSERFTAVTGGLEFDLSLEHLNLGINTIGVKANYSDYRKANADSLSLTIEAVVEEETHILVAPLTGIAHEINGVLASPEALEVYRQSFTTGGSLLAAEAGTALADTGYPVIESITQTTFAVDATAHLVSMPATVNAGDGLLVFLTTDGDATVTTPAGWKRLYNEANGSALRGTAYAKVGRGTEGGTTVDFVTSASENGAAQVYRITNWNGSLAGIQAGVVGEVTTGSTADPAAVTAYWGSAKNMCISVCHTSTSQTVSSGPSSYTDLTQTSSAAASTGAQVITARRSVEAATEDPGVFTMSGTGESKVYNTIVIAPAYAAAPKYEHFEITSGTTLWAGVYTSQPIGVADTGITRAVIVCHGSGLDVAEYANIVQKNLTSYLGKVIVVAPFFAESSSDPETGQLFWGSSWSELGLSDSSLAWRISSGGVLDELIEHLYATFVNMDGVILAGHSAGGQLVNRYSAASADTRNRYLVSAASSYLYPGIERSDGLGGWEVPVSPTSYDDYKYGMSALNSISYVNAIGAAALRSRLLAAKVHYMVGADDDDPADTSMDLTDDAATQGAHRVERQQLYHDYLMYYTGDKQISISMASGLTQYKTSMDTLQISFDLGTPVSVDIVRNAELEFAGWPNGPILSDFAEVTGGITFDLNLAVLNLGNNSIGVTATYADASTAMAFLTLNILEVVAPPPPTPPSPLPAFPGAEGFGAASVGGRGGTIIKVTNLNDSGAGSLREALLAEYPRTVVFTIGGTINLLSDIDISGASRSYLTVAGQTAPGGGIQTRYKAIQFSDGVHDVILRYVRHRRGWEYYEIDTGNNGPGLTFYSYGSPVYNIIVDHCSFAWAQDDTGFWNKVHDVTWQWCILAEAKNSATGPSDLKGTSGKGMNSGAEPTEGANMYNVSIHHNLLASNYSRNPAIAGDGPYEIVNNLCHNYGQFGMDLQNRGSGCRANIIGNHFKAGPDTNASRYAITASGEVVGNHYEQANDMMYVLDNITPQRTSGAQPEWDAIGYCGATGTFCGVAATTDFQKATPWTVSSYPITVADAVDVPALVLADVGANAPARDATDTRIVSEYWAGIGSIHTHNDWPTLASGTLTVDTDTVVNPHSIAANGYTNLENYINSVV